MDLSSPEGYSVNNGIDKEDCSFHYVSVDTATAQIAKSGQGTLLAKMDIKQAYRNIPVAPQDRHLLGFQWQGKIYIEKVLPFGLRSSPLIFSATADALLWVMQQNGVSWAIHYVDDFLTIGKPESDKCQRNMHIMHDICSKAGLPLEPTKTQGPSETLTFLGIELDATRMEIRLPTGKLTSAKDLLNRWRGRKACRKHDLLSLIGILAHASKVVGTSWVFLRRLIKLATTTRKPQHFIRLNAEAKSDIEWWYQFIQQWNGTSIIRPPVETHHILTTDASGSWGCGTCWQQEWFQLQWSGMLQEAHISIKELTPVVLVAGVWGRRWSASGVQVLSDNTAMVAAINNQTSRIEQSAHLLRCLAFLSTQFQCTFVAEHLPGRHNARADALSRNN